MFKRIDAVYSARLYKNFVLENERHFNVEIHGAQPFEENLWIEPMSCIALTEKNGYVGCCFADLCKGEIENFGVGIYLTAKGEISINASVLKENMRKKLTGTEEIIINGKEEAAMLYPIFAEGFDIYADYIKETNSLGLVSVKKGLSVTGERNIIKFGCSFSRSGIYYKEDCELPLFEKCSFLTLWEGN